MTICLYVLITNKTYINKLYTSFIQTFTAQRYYYCCLLYNNNQFIFKANILHMSCWIYVTFFRKSLKTSIYFKRSWVHCINADKKSSPGKTLNVFNSHFFISNTNVFPRSAVKTWDPHEQDGIFFDLLESTISKI